MKKDEIVFCTPKIWDFKTHKGEILRTVTFDSMYFELGGKKYLIWGTQTCGDDAIHRLKNLETGEYRDVKGSTIRLWLDKFALSK
jgi:hypothetical protein